ncbi:MAG: ACT domain-containing protein [Planctomycetota bacterium]
MPEPAQRLDEALATMRWHEVPGRFAIVGIEGPPDLEDLGALAKPAQLIVEDDETTLLVHEDRLAHLLERHPDAKVELDLTWFTFETPMDWEVVGFLAHVTRALAEEGVSLGAVCGYSRDHVFVHARHRETTRRILGGMFPEGVAPQRQPDADQRPGSPSVQLSQGATK